mmetsp:Transcript_110491/g.155074  ORF Transcript_110491/g.155074 Transcript_110491/m.155074 type:complete len:89 (+) Transcript_110491:1010-1276(+)
MARPSPSTDRTDPPAGPAKPVSDTERVGLAVTLELPSLVQLGPRIGPTKLLGSIEAPRPSTKTELHRPADTRAVLEGIVPAPEPNYST